MAWLIRKRATAKGRLDKHLKDLERLPAVIAQVRAEIANLDMVIPMHEVVVDPQEIKGKRTCGPRIAPYGAMAKAVLECLKLAGGRPVYKSEVAMHFIRRENLDIDKVRRSYVFVRIQKTLKTMCSEGKICRHHAVGVGLRAEGRWSLPPDDAPSA